MVDAKTQTRGATNAIANQVRYGLSSEEIRRLPGGCMADQVLDFTDAVLQEQLSDCDNIAAGRKHFLLKLRRSC
jgi:hypothetical protein